MSTSEPSDRYHHGDLRRALVEAALELLLCEHQSALEFGLLY